MLAAVAPGHGKGDFYAALLFVRTWDSLSLSAVLIDRLKGAFDFIKRNYRAVRVCLRIVFDRNRLFFGNRTPFGVSNRLKANEKEAFMNKKTNDHFAFVGAYF